MARGDQLGPFVSIPGTAPLSSQSCRALQNRSLLAWFCRAFAFSAAGSLVRRPDLWRSEAGRLQKIKKVQKIFISPLADAPAPSHMRVTGTLPMGVLNVNPENLRE